MKLSLSVIFGMLIISCNTLIESERQMIQNKPEYVLVIHGGAGTITRQNMTPEKEAAYRAAMENALNIGENILKTGGSSLDAVEQTIWFLEDSPLFNAGKGAVFTNAGTNELDASIMNGADQNAGAVGGISVVRHPISAARAVMEKSEHVFLAGKGAEEFSRLVGLEIVDPEYFYTERRWNSLEQVKKVEAEKERELTEEEKHGTVGVVALDKNGNIVAGTSTGGMTNKKYNRIGDSPVIGAGTYADNSTCGVSSTGHGEYFIRYAVAHAIHAQMKYGDKTLKEAADHTIMELLVEKGGTGGVVCLDKDGNIAMPFNTEGMYRAYAKPGERFIGIYNDDREGSISDK